MANDPDQELVVKVGYDITDLQKGMAQAGTIVEQSAGAMAKSTVSSAGVVSKEWQRSSQVVGTAWKSTWDGVAKASMAPITLMDQQVSGLQKKFLALAATVGGLSAIKSALEFGDELNKTSDRLGIAAEKLQAFQYSARFFGLGAGEVTTFLERMNETIGRAVAEGGESAEVFNRLGINLSSIAGLRVDEQYSAIAEAISKLPTLGLQAAAANEIFARSGFRMIEMLKGGKTSLSEAEKELASFGGTINGISADKLEEANDSIARMAESFKAASRVLAISLAPSIITITKLFKDMFGELNKGSNSDFFPVMNRAFVILLGTGAEVVSMFKNAWIAISSVVKLVSTIPDLLTGNLENAEKKVEEIGSAFESTKMVGEAFSGVLDTHRKSLDEIVKLEQEAAAQTKESLGTRKEDVAEIIKAREAGAARKEQEKEAARALKDQAEYIKKVNEEMANRQISLRIGESGARYLQEYAELQKAAAALQVQAAAADAALQRLLTPKAPGRGIQMELPGSEGQTVDVNQIKAIKEFNEAKAALDRAYAASALKSNDAIAEGEVASFKQREQALIDFYKGQVGKEEEFNSAKQKLTDEKFANLGDADAERIAAVNNHYNLLLARVKAYEAAEVITHAQAAEMKAKIDADAQKATADAREKIKRDYLASIRDQQQQTLDTWKTGLDGQLQVTQQYAQATSGIFGNLAAAMDTHSRKGFETWKAMATAQAIVDTIASAVAAFKSMAGIPYVGVPLGLAAAAAALAAGYANVRRIQATKFGDKNPPGGSGYGGTPVGSSAGGGVGNGGNESSQGERRTSTYNISITGSMFGRDQMRALLDQLRSTQADSGNVYNVSYNN